MEIMEKLGAIEAERKKSPPYRFGPRTIDLDLLLYDDLVLPSREEWLRLREDVRRGREEGLVIPHPRMHERRFVLEPLCELLDYRASHPVLGPSWETFLRETRDQHVEKTAMTL